MKTYDRELASIIGKDNAEWFNEQLLNFNAKYHLFKRVTTEELKSLRISSYNYLM
jgi:hypothetical protein